MNLEFPTPYRSDDELLEFIRAAVDITGPCDRPDPPRDVLDDDQWQRAREGGQVSPIAVKATGLWKLNCSRALQISRKRLGSLLWALAEADARKDDPRFAKAIPFIASKMALFGVGVVPPDVATRRKLVERWTSPHDAARWEQPARTEAA